MENMEKTSMGNSGLPEAIRLKLSPLRGLCTYQLLDNIRFGGSKPVYWNKERVSDNINDWFGQLRETTSEWSYSPLHALTEHERTARNLSREGMLSGQWRNMGEELLALDKAIRVPRDAPEISSIFKSITCIPEYVVKKINAKYPEMKMSIQPMGSYPANAKVIDVDEFDFLAVCDFTHISFLDYRLWWSRMNNDFPAIISDSLCPKKEDPAIFAPFDTDDVPLTSEPCIYKTYKHGPAQCIELRWNCHPDSIGGSKEISHEHTISIDITFAYTNVKLHPRILEMPTTLKAHIKHFESKPIFKDIYRSIDDSEMAMFLAGRHNVTTSVLDRKICHELEKVSTNIMVVYRLAKVLTQLMLPSVSNQPQSSRMLCPLSQLVDSHTLKHILFSGVASHPETKQWETSKIHVRLTDVLQRVKIKQGPDFITIEDDLRSSLHLKQAINRGITMATLGKHRDNLDALMQLLMTAYGQSNDDKIIKQGFPLSTKYQESDTYVTMTTQPMTVTPEVTPEHHHVPMVTYFPQRIRLLMLVMGRMHPLSDDTYKVKMVSDAKGTTLFYRLSDAPMMFQTHPLIIFCHEYIHELYVESPGQDLSTVDWWDFRSVWNLYLTGFLSAEDLENCELRDAEIRDFMQMIAVFGRDQTSEQRLLGSLFMGRDLYCVMTEVLNFADTPPGMLEAHLSTLGLLEVLPEIIGKLDANERAFIHKWCRLALNEKDTLFGCDSLLHRRTLEGSDHLVTILRCLEITYVTIERYGEGGLLQAFLQSHILVLHVMRHVWFKNRDFFTGLRQEHFAWAEQKLNRMRQDEQSRLPSVIVDDLDSTEVISRDIGEIRVVRVEKGAGALDPSLLGAGSFYRCLAACWNPIYLRSMRSRGGSHLETSIESKELLSAETIKLSVAHTCREQEEHLDRLVSSGEGFIKTSTKTNKSSLTDNPTSGWCIEMLAATHVIQTQIKIYEHIGDKYVHTLSIPPAPLGDGHPLCLLYENYINDKPEYGHYSLIVWNSTPLPNIGMLHFSNV